MCAHRWWTVYVHVYVTSLQTSILYKPIIFVCALLKYTLIILGLTTVSALLLSACCDYSVGLLKAL